MFISQLELQWPQGAACKGMFKTNSIDAHVNHGHVDRYHDDEDEDEKLI